MQVACCVKRAAVSRSVSSSALALLAALAALTACGTPTGGSGASSDTTTESPDNGVTAGEDALKTDAADTAGPGDSSSLTDAATDAADSQAVDAADDAAVPPDAAQGDTTDAAAGPDSADGVTATCILLHVTGNGQAAVLFGGMMQPAAGGEIKQFALDTKGEYCADTALDTQYLLSTPALPSPTGYLQYPISSGHVQATCGGNPKACLVVNIEFNTTGKQCKSLTECDDGNACTDDNCGIFGLCVHTNSPQKCTGATACDVGMCELGACKLGALCDDQNGCTTDVCEPGNTCSHAVNDGGACKPSNVCNVGKCDASGTCKDTGVYLNCDDNNFCTSDYCAWDKGGCVYDPSIFKGAPCTVDTVEGKCNSVGACDVPACDDGKKQEQETGVDCGGWCGQCADGLGCALPADCSSSVCTNSVCATPTCNDQIKNGEEAAMDCGGGGCPGCPEYTPCTKDSQCASGWCSNFGFCKVPSCNDNAQNSTETDVDCGGGCPPCQWADKKCIVDTDCASKVCTGGKCVNATCSDGVKNGYETATDCGGFDKGSGCPGCGTGGACSSKSDCKDKSCQNGTCVPAACDDGIMNGGETGIDCGGAVVASGCTLCADYQGCLLNSDCVSKVCGIYFVCEAPACNDGVANGTESDTDCGGICGPYCQTNAKCNANNDCVTDNCAGGLCAVKLANGITCTADADCTYGHCVDGVCCDSACTEECLSCDGAVNGGYPGICAGIQVGIADTMCKGVQVCNYNGVCSLPQGSACTNGNQCVYGNCYDNVCCDTICLGTCTTCNAPGSAGICSAVPEGQDPHKDCLPGYGCSGMLGYCKVP